MDQRRLDLILLLAVGALMLMVMVFGVSHRRQAAHQAAKPHASSPASGPAANPAANPAATPPANPQTPTPAQGNPAPPLSPTQNVQTTVPGTAPTTVPPTVPTTEPSPATPAAGPSAKISRVGFTYTSDHPGACGDVAAPWQSVALSRDLLKRFPCGSEVLLELQKPVAGQQAIYARVSDTMSAREANTVNIFVGQDEPALEYGGTEGVLSAN